MAIAEKLIEFFFAYIIMRGIIAPFITMLFKKYALHPLFNYFKKHFLRTEREVAIWLHYRNKAINKGHNHDLMKCDDGQCTKI